MAAKGIKDRQKSVLGPEFRFNAKAVCAGSGNRVLQPIVADALKRGLVHAADCWLRANKH